MTTPPEPPAYATIREGIALREQGRSPEARALMESLVAGDPALGQPAPDRLGAARDSNR